MVAAFGYEGLRGKLSLREVRGTRLVRKGLWKAGSRSISHLLWGPSQVCDSRYGKEEQISEVFEVFWKFIMAREA